MSRHDSGFTLLEVLVAFVIAALAVAALLQGAGAGLGAARIAANTQEALSRARSRLAALSAVPPEPGEQSGTEPGGFGWRSTVRQEAVTAPIRAQAGSPASTRRTALLALTVVVSWTSDGGRRQVALTTRRVADVGPPPP